jgi:hypothetical protein
VPPEIIIFFLSFEKLRMMTSCGEQRRNHWVGEKH